MLYKFEKFFKTSVISETEKRCTIKCRTRSNATFNELITASGKKKFNFTIRLIKNLDGHKIKKKLHALLMSKNNF